MFKMTDSNPNLPVFSFRTLYPDEAEFKAAEEKRKAATVKSYNIQESVGFQREIKKWPSKINLCMWGIQGTSHNTEEFFKTTGLQELGIDWGYIGGRQMIFMLAPERPMEGETDLIESRIVWPKLSEAKEKFPQLFLKAMYYNEECRKMRQMSSNKTRANVEALCKPQSCLNRCPGVALYTKHWGFEDAGGFDRAFFEYKCQKCASHMRVYHKKEGLLED